MRALSPYVEANVAVMYLGTGGTIPASTRLAMPGLLEYLNSFLPEAEATVQSFGGSSLRLPFGDLLAIWGLNGQRPCHAAMALAKAITAKVAEGIAQGYPIRQASIGLSRGPCAIRMEENACADVAGDPVNSALSLQRQARH